MAITTKTPDFNAQSEKVLSPTTLAHFVLRTNNQEAMKDFYITFLGGHLVHSNDFVSFITYDEEHHRIALIGMPNIGPKATKTNGLEHTAFTFSSISSLLLAYRQRKARGITPIWCVNHGPTSSIYYRDPDGNMIETQADNFDTADEATAFMLTNEFNENPLGADFDPEDWIERIEHGLDENELKKREEVGPRGLPDFAFE